MALPRVMPQESRAVVLSLLAILFATSMGEAYFPDVMNINTLKAKANWLFLADAIGIFSLGVIPTKQGWKDIPFLKASVPAVCNMISQMFLLGGIALSSAQTKVILYNSTIVWSALLSRFLLGQILNIGQWIGVCVTIIGLIIEFDFGGDSDHGEDIVHVLGMCCILIGCVLDSLTNTISEYYIRTFDFPPPKLAALIGLISVCTWSLLFACGLIIPEMQDGELITSTWGMDHNHEMHRQSPDTPLVNWIAWIGFVLSRAGDSLVYFTLLGSIGNVSLGVMKGFTSKGYVVLSVVVLCNPDRPSTAKYCFTWKLFFSATICFLGVLIYARFTKVADKTSSSLVDAPGTSSGTSLADAETFNTELRDSQGGQSQPHEGNTC